MDRWVPKRPFDQCSKRLRDTVVALTADTDNLMLDTLVFGGFVNPGGGWADEKTHLDEAISEVRWAGLAKRGLRLRPIVVVTSSDQTGLARFRVYSDPTRSSAKRTFCPNGQGGCDCSLARNDPDMA